MHRVRHLFLSRVKMSCRLWSQKEASRHMSLVSASSADARSVALADRRFLQSCHPPPHIPLECDILPMQGITLKLRSAP